MQSETFDEIDEFPNPATKKRYELLVGLDNEKIQLSKEGRIMLNPTLLDSWSKEHYNDKIPLLEIFKSKPSLFIFSGDVGTGKTSLAETFGDAIAREEKIPIFLYRLSLKSRGSGTVGEMTRLLSSAFQEIAAESKKAITGKKPSSGYILLIDEADALAQSRELDQMHHEDKAGVNALIRGIDSVSGSNMPVLVVMCTNRLSALDPAVRRRAAAIFEFHRPNEEQRHSIFFKALAGTDVDEKTLKELVKATGENKEVKYGLTYSDIMQRFLPSILLSAFPDRAIDWEDTIRLAKEFMATPPFKIQ